jgi:phage replication O-like protein O
MANPQKEHGYTPIANELLEKIALLPLNGSQMRIVCVVWRYTYGFSRKSHELSEGFISKCTGISRRHISTELNKLISNKIITEITPPTKTRSRTVSFNKDYDKWGYRTTVQQGVEQIFNTPIEESFNTPVEQQFNTPIEELFNTQNGENQNKKPANADNSNADVGVLNNSSPGEQLFNQDKQIYIYKTNNKTIYKEIFNYYISKKIVEHKKMTAEMEKDIDKALKDNSVEEIKTAIDHYAEAYHDKSFEFCSYAWGIHELFTRKEGYKRFLDDGSKWLNYLKHKEEPQKQCDTPNWKRNFWEQPGYDGPIGKGGSDEA